ncbi:hypothetical protein ACIBCB_35505 [Streptomyces uncialis]|uniref:hypothetical protein n=1 Tax=Streptomyces uncialis TaxID=1048205 RepID=UPI003791B4A1
MNPMKTTGLPKMLRFSAPGVREHMEALAASQVLIGVADDGQPVCIDLDGEGAHVLVCSGTGGGTTTVLRTLAAQFLHDGSDGLVLDHKRISHRWASGMPGVTYCRDIADIHDALVRLRDEIWHRVHHVDQHGDTGDLTRLTVVCEVAHHTLNQLARHWNKVRQAGDPKTSPAIDAFHEALYAGRAARIHVLYGGHVDNTSLGAPAREQFSTVVLGRVTSRAWSRLAPHIHPAPKSSPLPGRVHVVQHSTARPVQALLMTEAEAAAWATATPAEEG